MNRQQILEKFPKASESFIRANEDNRVSPSPVPQRPVRNEPLATTEGKESHAGRISVRVTSYRKRLIDPDNLCVKYFIDCLRYAGILRDDTAACVALTVAQEKVKENERTEIELFV